MARHQLRAGDLVETNFSAPPAKAQTLPPVLYDEHDLLIVSKPAGITSNGKNSLEDFLRSNFSRPQLTALHRLDKDTTGCFMLTTNSELRQKIIQDFREQRVTKTYHAIVCGKPNFKTREMTLPLDGKKTISYFRVLDSALNYAHLQISIPTGRTHQIRRHLEALELPLAGDRRYSAGRKVSQFEMSLKRQMLHARILILPHPSAKTQLKVEAPLPADFRRALQSLRLK